MRSLYAAALLSIAFLPLVTAHSTRKSLRFGPHHPTARYVTEPQVSSFAAHTDPFDVARAFLQSHTDSDYYIRDDSYTDRSTGTTHVYVRQRVDGIEVADGDINLNIRDGRVLSFGDSFFRGSAPSLDARPSTSHATHCADFAGKIMTLAHNPQFVLAGRSQAHEDLYALHCARPLAAVREAAAADTRKDTHDPRRAALYFMIAAHPESSAVEELTRNFDATLDHMTVAYEPHFVGQDAHASAIISGLPGAVNLVKARVVYVQTPTGNETELHATWRLEIEMVDNWYEAYVSVNDPSTIVAVADWAADSSMPRADGHLNALEAKIAMGQPIRYTEAGSYNVWRWGLNDPTAGERTVEPASYDSIASPFGWHTISKARNPPGSPDWVGKGRNDRGAKYLNFTTTWGNNVLAHENWEGRDKWISKYRPEGGEDLNFTFEYGVREGRKKNPKDYIDLAITQLFYTSNMVHDLFYRYGFDERAGNFQQDNYGRGGRDGDAVIANAQDGSSYNNANFVTPPDGQHGRCRMYIWNTATPYRDGDLEAGLVIHEFSHGLSNRLTGGPSNAGCLVWGESGGMGEGWGDFFATTVRSTKDHRRDFPVGDWANNKPGGARNHPYSTNRTVNPSTYETLNEADYWILHSIGEVWAEILWVVLHKMVEKHGYSPNLFPPQPLANGTIPIGDFYHPPVKGKPLVPRHGNTLMLQLVITGMKHQPCRPSFFEARDAIIDADKALTGGKNFCDLWAAFGSRGLGQDAWTIGGAPWGGAEHANGFKVPDECK